MANKHEIELFISDDGELKVHIKGMKGPGCLKVFDSLAKDLGIVENKRLTGEYYESAETKKTSGTNLKKNR